MRLFISPISPYVRKVEIVAHLKGLGERLEKVKARDVGVDIETLNPLAKVPTFITDDGEVLIESGLICQYLDEIGAGPKLYGNNPDERRRILQTEAIGDGVLDAAVACRMEVREHSPEKQSASWLERQEKKVKAGLHVVEKSLAGLAPQPGIAHISHACMLFFIDQHKVFPGWRDAHPALASWYATIRQTPIFAATEPKLGG